MSTDRHKLASGSSILLNLPAEILSRRRRSSRARYLAEIIVGRVLRITRSSSNLILASATRKELSCNYKLQLLLLQSRQGILSTFRYSYEDNILHAKIVQISLTLVKILTLFLSWFRNGQFCRVNHTHVCENIFYLFFISLRLKIYREELSKVPKHICVINYHKWTKKLETVNKLNNKILQFNYST